MIAIRTAEAGDKDVVFKLARELSTSFDVEREAFSASFATLLDSPDAFIAVAVGSDRVIGYLLGFVHGTFYANGKVGWIEEVFVTDSFRRHGVGRLLVDCFEQWAKVHHIRLTALATRRASPFYLRLGYEESATYFRKLL